MKLSNEDRSTIVFYYQSWKQHNWRTVALIRTMAHNYNVSTDTIHRIIKEYKNAIADD